MLPEKTPDTVVSTTALRSDATLVAIDRDMRQIAQRYGVTRRNDRFARLNLILLCCEEILASKRVRYAMSFIEHEWAVSQAKTSQRMWIEIGPHYLKSHR